jgi:uncharacterized protein YkwD
MRSSSPRLLVLGVALGLLVVTSGCLGTFGGGGSPGTPDTADTAPSTATATPTPTNSPANGTASPTASPTDGGSPSPSPSPSRSPTRTPRPDYDLNTTEVENAVRERINARRAESGYDRLSRTRTGNLSAMAGEYSSALAAVGFPTHEAGGETPRDRYERHGLLDRCRVTNNANRGVLTPSELEILGIVRLGENQTIDGTTYVATNETAAAEVLVEQWYAGSASGRALSLADARYLGIGLTVEDGTVYATGNLC